MAEEWLVQIPLVLMALVAVVEAEMVVEQKPEVAEELEPLELPASVEVAGQPLLLSSQRQV